MLAKRIIPCLDVTGGRVVKGVNFVELRDAGDPVEIAARYNAQGADELTFLYITATSDGRDLILHIIEAVASQVFIPLTVGGGVRTVDDVRRLLNAGADKTSFNSAAIANPQVIADSSAKYGAQCIVVAIDAKLEEDGKWRCYINGGHRPVERELLDWALEAQDRGAGEILFTSMSHDGVKNCYPNEALAMLADRLSIPLIASGGAGTMEHFKEAFVLGKADAALAASIFHYKEIGIPELKVYLKESGIVVR